MINVDVNFWAVLAAAIVPVPTGLLWYSMGIYGKEWMKLVGLTPEKLKNASESMAKNYSLSLLMHLLMAFVLANVVGLVGVNTWQGGLSVGFWMWLGFIYPVMLINSLYQKKSYELVLIDSGYQLLNLLIMGAMLGAWV